MQEDLEKIPTAEPERSDPAGSVESLSVEPDPDLSEPVQADPAETEEADPTLAAHVAESVTAGVAPLEMRYCQINSCYRRLPIAYRSFTYINSVIEGVLSPEKYSFASDSSDRGIRLAKWNIKEAVRALRSFEAAGRHVEFVTARCPAKLCLVDDLYEWMKNVLEEIDFHEPQKLCLEFSQSILFEDLEKVRASVLAMKLLKVKTLMTGCGEADCPVTSLLQIPVDYVLLAPHITALTDNRNKGGAVSAFLAFLRSLPVQVIGDGVMNDSQIRALSRADTFGYVPSSGYVGEAIHGKLRMTLQEAVAQSEEEEFR